MTRPNARARARVALILAVAVAAGVVMLTAAALYDVLADPNQNAISAEYASIITSTLGVLVGGLVGYIAGRPTDDDEPVTPPADTSPPPSPPSDPP